MELRLQKCTVRSYRRTDAESLARHANNPKIARNLRDRFPHPYSHDDAVTFIEHALGMDPETLFAIEVDGAAAGGMGLCLGSDVDRVSAEIGYWLAEAYWGRGIVTEALIALTKYAIETYGLTRVFAVPYVWNPASHRVLEKAGYQLEGRLRRSVIKEGRIIDQLQYAYVVEETD